jgi:hypothetical protein
MSENTMYQDFIKAQKEFKPVLLNRTNPFHKSRYADLGSHLDSVLAALNRNNFSLIQKTHDCDSGVCVETILYHESGNQISGGMLRVPVVKNDPQGYGAALTYARRFSLGALLSLYGEEDNDGNEHIQNTNKQPINKPSLEQRVDKAKESQQQAKIKNIQELTLEAQNIACKGLNALETWWKSKLSQSERDILQADLQKFKSQAKEFDHINQDIGE